jgi:hypothetical protein
MKKFALAVLFTVGMVGFVVADEFTAEITKIDGTKVTYKKAMFVKGEKPKTDDKATTTEVSAKLAVVKGKFDKDAGKVTDGDAIEGGLKADAFKDVSDDKGVFATITVADDGADKGKITKIRLFGGKKKQ